MTAILNLAAILENGYFYSFLNRIFMFTDPKNIYFDTSLCEYMYFSNFLAKNVRHFGFDPLAACSTNYFFLDF